MSRALTDDDVRVLILREVDRAGSQAALARQWDISAQYLGDVLSRKRGVSESIGQRLGLRRETRWRRQ